MLLLVPRQVCSIVRRPDICLAIWENLHRNWCNTILFLPVLPLFYNICLRRNSLNVMAVAVATFKDSLVGWPGGYEGISSRRLTIFATSSDMPRPSLPIIIMPVGERFVSYMFCPSRKVPKTPFLWFMAIYSVNGIYSGLTRAIAPIVA